LLTLIRIFYFSVESIAEYKQKGRIVFTTHPIHHHPSLEVITPQIFLILS